jgi:hypothetical protein
MPPRDICRVPPWGDPRNGLPHSDRAWLGAWQGVNDVDHRDQTLGSVPSWSLLPQGR